MDQSTTCLTIWRRHITIGTLAETAQCLAVSMKAKRRQECRHPPSAQLSTGPMIAKSNPHCTEATTSWELRSQAKQSSTKTSAGGYRINSHGRSSLPEGPDLGDWDWSVSRDFRSRSTSQVSNDSGAPSDAPEYYFEIITYSFGGTTTGVTTETR